MYRPHVPTVPAEARGGLRSPRNWIRTILTVNAAEGRCACNCTDAVMKPHDQRKLKEKRGCLGSQVHKGRGSVTARKLGDHL